MKDYNPVPEMPIAKLWYRGSHSHFIRRTVVIIEMHSDRIVGYEIREGAITRKLKDAPIKSYSKYKIAKYSDLRAGNHKKPGPEKTTLRRMSYFDLLRIGI